MNNLPDNQNRQPYRSNDIWIGGGLVTVLITLLTLLMAINDKAIKQENRFTTLENKLDFISVKLGLPVSQPHNN